MHRAIAIFILLLLLGPAFNIAAQGRRAQPARLALPSDSRAGADQKMHVTAASSVVAVNVDAAKVIRNVGADFTGINAAVWDSSFESQTTITFLKSMGARILRFPGGSLSDEYHWETNTTLKNTWTWATSFDDFAAIANAVKTQAIITVNYGTGSADEAARWVEYSNTTRGYGFKYWEIGNENYGTWETDGHKARNDPYTYGLEASEYIQKMRLADPAIKIGVVVTTGEDNYINNTAHPATNPRTGIVHNGWTPVLLATLKSLNTIPDFVIYHRYEQNPGNESDARLLQSTATWKNDAADLRRQLEDYLGSAADPIEIICTENNSVSFDPGKQTTSLVNGLFLADSVGNILQTEFNMFVWWDLRNGYVTGKNNSPSLYGWRQYGDYGISSVDNEPYPSYYVFKLLSHFALPSDSVVEAKSQSSLLSSYGVKSGDGRLKLMLINKSPGEEITAQINIAGYSPSPSAVVYSYGKAEDEAARNLAGSPDIAQSLFHEAGTAFDYTLPPYSIAVISLLPQGQDFEMSVTPSSRTINVGEDAEFDIAAVFANGFDAPVSISAEADETTPLDISMVQPTLTSSQKASLIVSAEPNSPPQSYNVTIRASGGGVEKTARLTVTVMNPPIVNSAKYNGKKLIIKAEGLGEQPRVIINGLDRTDRIKSISGSKIKIKGKKEELGIVAGDNTIRVVRGLSYSDAFRVKQ